MQISYFYGGSLFRKFHKLLQCLNDLDKSIFFSLSNPLFHQIHQLRKYHHLLFQLDEQFNKQHQSRFLHY